MDNITLFLKENHWQLSVEKQAKLTAAGMMSASNCALVSKARLSSIASGICQDASRNASRLENTKEEAEENARALMFAKAAVILAAQSGDLDEHVVAVLNLLTPLRWSGASVATQLRVALSIALPIRRRATVEPRFASLMDRLSLEVGYTYLSDAASSERSLWGALRCLGRAADAPDTRSRALLGLFRLFCKIPDFDSAIGAWEEGISFAAREANHRVVHQFLVEREWSDDEFGMPLPDEWISSNEYRMKVGL